MLSSPTDELDPLLKELKEEIHRAIRSFALAAIYNPSFDTLAIMAALKVDRKNLLVDILREIADNIQELNSLQ